MTDTARGRIEALLKDCVTILKPFAFPEMPLDRLPDPSEFSVWISTDQVRQVRELVAAIEEGEPLPVLAKTGEVR